MASNTPKATRTSSATTTPIRGRGRGRPRLYSRGSSSALARRRSTSTPKATEPTPSARRKIGISAGYRPGGAGGGGRYIHPKTGEEIPAAIWKELVKRGDSSLEGFLTTSSTTTPRRAPPAPPPPPLPVGPDGVYKPREERSYTEFHPSFDPDSLLPIYSALQIDGENYKPPSSDQNKSVKIADIKDEDQRREDFHASLPENTNLDDGQSIDGIYTSHNTGFPASPSLNGGSNFGSYEGHGSMGSQSPANMGDPNFGSPMEGIQPTHNFGDIAVDPALAGLTRPPPPSIDPSLILPIDPSLAAQQQQQVQTPAITPTDGLPKDENLYSRARGSPQEQVPGTPGTAKRGKEVPTLASTRPHRSNAGKPPPRSVPPASARRSRPSNQVTWGDEKLQLRTASFRPIQPYKYSDVAWNSAIGSTGAFGLNTAGSSEHYSAAMIKVGYQKTDLFERPTTLLRDYPDNTIDEELGCGQYDIVEYDMDEQDDKWLTNLNSHRALEHGATVTREVFEIAMTKIEKEWVNLERRIPKISAKPHGAGGSRRRSSGRNADDDDDDGAEDSKCVICDDGECENANAIVFCDGCNLAVHQECYGVPYIPEGQWHCRKCQQIPRQTANCVFCPNTDGAFKQTSTNRWAHLLCAIWIPEVRLANPSFMEPVEGMEFVPKSRWKLTCYICKQKMGACIQCSNKNCFVAFHVTCGRRARLHMKMKNSSGPGAQLESSGLKALCDKHVPPDWRKENDVDNAIQDAMDFYAQELYGRDWGDSQAAAISGPGMLSDDEYGPNSNVPRVSFKLGDKRKRHTEPKAIWKLPSGAPVIPQVLYEKIADYMSQFDIKDVKEFTADVCKYWTLKREARRGAFLIRRLQIQADSSSFTSLEITRKNYASLGHVQGEKALGHRKDFAASLDHDLAEVISGLNDISKASEDHKRYGYADKLRDYVDAVYFPEILVIRNVMQKAKELDVNGTFNLGFSLIDDRIDHRLYPNVSVFSMDLQSVLQSPANEPRLDFAINVPDYAPPSRLRASSEENGGSSTDGQVLLTRLVPVVKQALAIESELPRIPEAPAKKYRKVDKVDGLNGASPIKTDGSNGVSQNPHSPSTQLEQESLPQELSNTEPAKTNAKKNTVLTSLASDVASSMAGGQWGRDYPQWFVNNYLETDNSVEGNISDSDYDNVIRSRTSKLDTLVPGPEPMDIEESSKPTTETSHAESNGVDTDEDMVDAPGDIDEEFLPALPSPMHGKDHQEDPVCIYSDLHDEDAEGEIDDEVLTADVTPHPSHVPTPAAEPIPEAQITSVKPENAETPSSFGTTAEPLKERTPPQPSPTLQAQPVTPHKSPSPALTSSAKAPESVNANAPDLARSPAQDTSVLPRKSVTPTQKSATPKKSGSPLKPVTPKNVVSSRRQSPRGNISPTKRPSPLKAALLENSPVRRKSTTPVRSPAGITKTRSSSTPETSREIRPLRIAPNPRAIHALPPVREPELATKYTEIRPVFHEDIRNDDDLLGGYRPEDLPSPVGDASPPRATPPMTNGAVAAIVNVALASNPPTSQPEDDSTDAIALPPLLPEQTSLAPDSMDLEMMTNTSALSDYPENSDDENEGLHLDDDKKELNSSPQSGRKTRKAMEFTRDANGRFGKPKTPTRDRTTTTVVAPATTPSRTRRRLRGQ